MQAQNQIVETEHLFKALLEQPNGLARRILSKAGSNATDMLDKTDAYIRSQPRISGESAQVLSCCYVLSQKGTSARVHRMHPFSQFSGHKVPQLVQAQKAGTWLRVAARPSKGASEA